MKRFIYSLDIHLLIKPLRRSQYPTIHERIELQKEWTKKQLREAKIKSQQEAMTKLEQKRMLKLTDKNKKETKEIEDGPNNDEESVAVAERLEEDRIMEEALKEIENDDEAEEEADESNNQTKQKNAEYMEDLVNMKERKVIYISQQHNTTSIQVVASRDCHQYHQEMSGYGIWRRAFAHVYGPIFGIEPRRDKDYSEILPWLLVCIYTNLVISIASHFIYNHLPDWSQGVVRQPPSAAQNGSNHRYRRN